MNDPNVFLNPCAICKTAEADRLCDYIVEYNRNPIFFRDYQSFKESVEHGHDSTCDLPLCTKCRTLINGADLCPYHYEIYKKAQNLPEKLRKYQRKSKARIAQEMLQMSKEAAE
ncbi:hypothetical protein C6W27_16355 [Bacillus paralicheniformis]|nr:hypothetical protein C6W27_16355 [Bacillus paralicheniformis]